MATMVWFHVIAAWLLYSLVVVQVGSKDIQRYSYPDDTLKTVSLRPYNTSFLNRCCASPSPDALFVCVQHGPNASRPTSHIHLLTSLTSNILPYAAYVLAINSFYASIKGYEFKIIHGDGAVPYPSVLDPDARWNKIRFLADALQEIASDHYLVWLDADLAILNFNLQFEEIIEKFSEADIIMSRDKATAPFVGNTGTIIVRNTAWSRHFLELWWKSYDRRKCCDQNALTWLYERRVPIDVQQRVFFLPAHVINSDFPVWSQHDVLSRVLHLAGLTSIYRVEVFREAYQHICDVASTTGGLLHPQLGIDLQYLQRTANLLLNMRLEALSELLLEANQLLQQQQHHWGIDKIRSLRKLRVRVFDAIKQDDDDADVLQVPMEQQTSSKQAMEEIVLELRRLLYEAFAEAVQVTLRLPTSSQPCLDLRCPEVAESNLQDCVARIELVQDLVSTAIEYILAQDCSQHVHSNKAQVCQRVFDNLLFVVNDVLLQTPSRDKVQSRFLYYKFKHHQLSADMFQHQLVHHVHWLMESSLVWKEMVSKHQYYGSDYVLADPQKEYVDLLLRLGTVLCSSQRFVEGIHQLQLAIQAQEETIVGYNQIKIATNDIIRYAHILLAEIHFNFAICSYEADPTVLQRVQTHLLSTKSILEQHQAEQESSAYQPAVQLLQVVQHVAYDSDLQPIPAVEIHTDAVPKVNQVSPSAPIKKLIKLKKRAKK